MIKIRDIMVIIWMKISIQSNSLKTQKLRHVMLNIASASINSYYNLTNDHSIHNNIFKILDLKFSFCISSVIFFHYLFFIHF